MQNIYLLGGISMFQFLNRGLSQMTQITRIILYTAHNHFPKGETVTKDLLKSVSIRVIRDNP